MLLCKLIGPIRILNLQNGAILCVLLSFSDSYDSKRMVKT